MIQLKNISFAYNTDPVLSLKELVFEKGKIHALVGPNGCGKTTLLKILDGLLVPQKGEILVKGLQRKAGKNSRNINTVYVHQNPYLFDGTVLSNIAFTLKSKGLGKEEIRERAFKVLSQVNLSGFEKRKTSSLSGGEAQRAALARALALEPEILLLDEPTANVDLGSVRILEKTLAFLKETLGVTIIMSSHDKSFAFRCSDRICFMEKGEVDEPAENIFKGNITEKLETVSLFDCGKISIKVPSLSGEFRTAVLGYEEILLSDEEIRSTAQNRFYGTIISVAERKGSYDITVDIGIPITARITGDSYRQFNLSPGKQVHLAFKVSAVKLY